VGRLGYRPINHDDITCLAQRIPPQRANHALSVLLQSAAERRVIERPDLAVSFEEINEQMGVGTIKELEQRFLTAAQREAKYGAAQ
jgi:hypothetical protein